MDSNKIHDNTSSITDSSFTQNNSGNGKLTIGDIHVRDDKHSGNDISVSEFSHGTCKTTQQEDMGLENDDIEGEMGCPCIKYDKQGTHENEHDSQQTVESCLQTQHESSVGINIGEVQSVTLNIGQVCSLRQINITTRAEDQINECCAISETFHYTRHCQWVVGATSIAFGMFHYNSSLVANACALFRQNFISSRQNDTFVIAFKEACYSNSIVFYILVYIFIVILIVFMFIPLIAGYTRQRHK